MFHLRPLCMVVVFTVVTAGHGDEKKAPPAWAPRPFSEVKAELEKDGWRQEDPESSFSYLGGKKVTSVRIGDGRKRELKDGTIRQSYVVLFAPIDFPPGEQKVVRWVGTPSPLGRDKVVLDIEKPGTHDFFLEKGLTTVTITGVFNKWPESDQEKAPKPAGKTPQPEKPGDKPLVLSPEPARITATTTISLSPLEAALHLPSVVNTQSDSSAGRPESLIPPSPGRGKRCATGCPPGRSGR